MTTVGTMTLTEFVLARVAEDEAAIRADLVGRDFPDPARVLAECDAMRRIVGYREQYDHPQTLTDLMMYPALTVPLDRVLRILAAIWSDHPDFDEAWL